jgi:hypothetical protein
MSGYCKWPRGDLGFASLLRSQFVGQNAAKNFPSRPESRFTHPKRSFTVARWPTKIRMMSCRRYIFLSSYHFKHELTQFWFFFFNRTLSSSTLDALKQFYAERDAHTEKFAKLQAAAEERSLTDQGHLSMDMFAEDWNESQFWVCLSSPGLWSILSRANS